MKIKILLFIPIIGVLFSFIAVKKSALPQNTGVQNLNISFLLDLSDRIDQKKYPNAAMEIYQRDLQYIKSIEKAFISHIKTKKVIQLDDQMQVYFNPAPKSAAVNELSKQLRVNFNRNSNKNDILKIDKTFTDIPLKIYQSAIKDNGYIGSDIWRFFKKNVQDYCIKDKHRNILVIITDGYMFHKDSKFLENNKSSYLTPALIQNHKLTSSSYSSIIEKNKLGFIPATSGLNNLEIIVLGINPAKKNAYEEDVINKYWSDWFISMGVKKFYLKSADLPADLDPVLQKIILGK